MFVHIRIRMETCAPDEDGNCDSKGVREGRAAWVCDRGRRIYERRRGTHTLDSSSRL